MAAAAGHVFHVEFGINDTELTRALEGGKFAFAQKLIKENAQTSYLDEGCYQRIPLFIVLSGRRKDFSDMPRNFLTAKLLVQYGANVNHRVPETDIGAEYLGPGMTALELLVDLYCQATLHHCHYGPESSEGGSGFDFMSKIVIGLDGKIISDEKKLLGDICELIFIVLGQGGNVNIRNEFNMTPLHSVAVLSTDDRLLEILCEAGADTNAVDERGNTPLSALCDPFPYGTQHFVEHWDVVYSADEDIEDGCNPHLDCCNLFGKEQFLDYLLSCRDIQLDVQNRMGRTALFNCMVRGDLRSAVSLLQHGCDPSLRGKLLQPTHTGRTSYRSVSPLFAALCSSRVVKFHYEDPASFEETSYQFLAQLVDAGYFSRPEITAELHEYLQEDPALADFAHLQDLGSQVIHLMFGSTTSSLKQLSARKVLNACYLENSSRLKQFIQTTDLPKDTLVSFQVELLRQTLCRQFRRLRWLRLEDRDQDDENGVWGTAGSSDEDSTSNGGDSDLEYW